MKQKLTLLLSLVLLVGCVAFGQKKKNTFAPGLKKPNLFGIGFSLTDFNAPKNFGKNGNASSLSIQDMAAGFYLSYWSAITPMIDFSTKLNGTFYDYSSINYNLPGKTELGIELEPTVNIRPLKDQNLWAPFFTVGAGLGFYTSKIGAYVPVGVGVQFNSNNTTYFFLQAQFRKSLTPKVVGDNLYYSIGFAENIGGGGEPEVAKAPLPVVPAVPVIKDMDNDGVPDETDACPDVKGLVALKGCPDADGDGVTDKNDKCPDVRGLMKYGGCPIPDGDKDGINDEEDKCPEVAGLARYQGCPVPDTDKDGINDEDDKCPSVPGVVSNMGCPSINVATIEKINKAAANIFFATGSAKLLATSFTSLNSVAAILKDNTDYKVEINGYTDNKGDAAKNKALSESRAQAVSTYLVSKGIDANRLNAAGFGDESPIADNKTPAGRSKNRRVELKVKNY